MLDVSLAATIEESCNCFSFISVSTPSWARRKASDSVSCSLSPTFLSAASYVAPMPSIAADWSVCRSRAPQGP